jgi:hypothetical protein
MATDVRTTMGYTDFWALCEVDFGVHVGYDTARRFARDWAEIGKRQITFMVTSGNEIPGTLPAWLKQRAANQRSGRALWDESSGSVR